MYLGPMSHERNISRLSSMKIVLFFSFLDSTDLVLFRGKLLSIFATSLPFPPSILTQDRGCGVSCGP